MAVSAPRSCAAAASFLNHRESERALHFVMYQPSNACHGGLGGSSMEFMATLADDCTRSASHGRANRGSHMVVVGARRARGMQWLSPTFDLELSGRPRHPPRPTPTKSFSVGIDCTVELKRLN